MHEKISKQGHTIDDIIEIGIDEFCPDKAQNLELSPNFQLDTKKIAAALARIHGMESPLRQINYLVSRVYFELVDSAIRIKAVKPL